MTDNLSKKSICWQCDSAEISAFLPPYFIFTDIFNVLLFHFSNQTMHLLFFSLWWNKQVKPSPATSTCQHLKKTLKSTFFCLTWCNIYYLSLKNDKASWLYLWCAEHDMKRFRERGKKISMGEDGCWSIIETLLNIGRFSYELKQKRWWHCIFTGMGLGF